MAIGTGEVVAGVRRTPARYGLFSVADVRDQVDGRWEGGIQWEGLDCSSTLQVVNVECSGAEFSTDVTDAPGFGEAEAFAVLAAIKCHRFGRNDELALDLLEAREQSAVESRLWSDLAESTPEVLGAGAVSPTEGFALLEHFNSVHYSGGGVIHAPRHLVAVTGDFHDDEGTLHSKVGTRVVAGTGYGLSGPTGQADAAVPAGWVYLTPPLFVFRSEVYAPRELFKVRSNDFWMFAARNYLIGYDPCPVGGVLIDPTL